MHVSPLEPRCNRQYCGSYLWIWLCLEGPSRRVEIFSGHVQSGAGLIRSFESAKHRVYSASGEVDVRCKVS